MVSGRVDPKSAGEHIMKSISAFAAALLLAFAVVGLSACEKKGPAERAGEAVDDAARSAGDAVKDAGDKIKDATK